MFEKLLQKIDDFNELKDCTGTYTLIEEDGEITFITPDEDFSMTTYKDKETYLVEVIKPDDEWGKGGKKIIRGVISAGYDEEINNKRIEFLIEFMNSVEGVNLFNAQ